MVVQAVALELDDFDCDEHVSIASDTYEGVDQGWNTQLNSGLDQ